MQCCFRLLEHTLRAPRRSTSPSFHLIHRRRRFSAQEPLHIRSIEAIARSLLFTSIATTRPLLTPHVVHRRSTIAVAIVSAWRLGRVGKTWGGGVGAVLGCTGGGRGLGARRPDAVAEVVSILESCFGKRNQRVLWWLRHDVLKGDSRTVGGEVHVGYMWWSEGTGAWWSFTFKA
jgi:hypothetical protein